MAPFPETEIMTIKRLEVALRKMDFKLLKDGAYKLHEKYHSGYKFEYVDLLKEILSEVSTNSMIPTEIKGILIPTIEDILSAAGIEIEKTDLSEYSPQNRVSSLTSLSYGSKNEKPSVEILEKQTQNETKTEMQMKTVVQSPFSAQPFREFSTPQFVGVTKKEEDKVDLFEPEERTQQPEQPVVENYFKEEAPKMITLESPIPQISIQKPLDLIVSTKTISIFYSQESSGSKMKNISEYRALIKKLKEDKVSLNEILGLICEINTQANTNVSELKNLLEQLNLKDNKVNLITNSQSANLTDLMTQNDIRYTLLGPSEDNKLNLIPLFGLSNLFKCSECKMEYLNTQKDATALILECPRCKSPMFLDLYSARNTECELNLDYYNSALVAMANSDTWFLVHPSVNEKITLNMLKSALAMTNKVSEIYILDKDINTRENYKNLFREINPNVKINIQSSALEDFYKSI